MNNPVLITGGAGFIGSHLVDRLMQEGYKVRVVDDLSNGKLENIKQWFGDKNFEFTRGDLRDKNVALKSVKNANIVFHLAANPEVRLSMQKPDLLYETNVQVTHNLLEAIRKNDVEYLVFTSTSAVYGDAKVIPTPEDAKLEPISIYGACKLAAENLIIGYAKMFKIKALILRLANIIGKRATHGVIYDFINKLRRNPNKLEILGDGTQRKSYLHVDDCIDAILHLFECFKKEDRDYDVYNVGNEDWITVKEVAEIVCNVMNLDPEFYFTGGVDGGRGWRGDVKYMLLNIEKARAKGWRPKLSSKEAVRKAAEELLF